MHRRTWLIGIVLVACAASSAGRGEAREGEVVALQCGRLVDAKAATLGGASTIVVRGDRIEEVIAGRVAPDAARVIDLSEHTCMPGLIDLHVHLSSEYSQRSNLERFLLNPTDYAIRAVANAKKTLDAGFTTVRDLGGRGGSVLALRNAIRGGIVPGPRIHAAGKAIATTGGHADPSNGMRRDLMGDPGPDVGVINGADEARKAVRQRYKNGVDWIKITATGGVLSVAKSGQNPQFTEEELTALIDTANDYGLSVAAHAHGAEGMKRAVRAGVKTIDHGTLMDEETMALMKERGTWYVPTILAGDFVAQKAKEDGYFPKLVRPKAASIGPQIQRTFGRAYAAGVKIAFGTDTGVSPHGENAREFALMVEAGMPPLEAIRSATWDAAEVLEVQGDIGVIEPGKFADIVAAPGDPSADVSVLEQIDFVMKDGEVYRSPAARE